MLKFQDDYTTLIFTFEALILLVYDTLLPISFLRNQRIHKSISFTDSGNLF